MTHYKIEVKAAALRFATLHSLGDHLNRLIATQPKGVDYFVAIDGQNRTPAYLALYCDLLVVGASLVSQAIVVAESDALESTRIASPNPNPNPSPNPNPNPVILVRDGERAEVSESERIYCDSTKPSVAALPTSPPYTCCFCGEPSWIHPHDQMAHIDYYRQSDHVTPEDYAPNPIHSLPIRD